MKCIDFKPEGGKLVRMDYEINNGILKTIAITGDFFIYPEAAIKEIESILKGKPVKDIESIFKKYLKETKTTIIGFCAKDIGERLRGK